MANAGSGSLEAQAGGSTSELRDDVRSLARAFAAVALFGTAASGLSVGYSTVASAPPFHGRVGFCLLAAGAAFLAGGLVGFIFGVPKRVQRPAQRDETEGDAPREGYAGNSNLERVSDWLTKVLIGAGLTQLVNTPAAIRNAGSYVEGALGPGTGPLAALVLVYWGIAGFFFSYLFARRVLPSWYFRADQEGVVRIIRKQFRRTLGEVATRNLQVLEGDRSQAVKDDIVFNALYLPAPTGFEKAIAVAESVAEDDRSPAMHAYLASAYGQKYAWERQGNAAPTLLAQYRARALDAARRAVEKDKSWRGLLASFLDPKPGSLDDDLASFRDDVEFRNLLGL